MQTSHCSRRKTERRNGTMDKTDKGSGAAPTSMTRTTSSHEQHVPCAGISRRARINRGSRNDTRAVGNHAGRAGHVGALHFLRLKEHVIGGARAPSSSRFVRGAFMFQRKVCRRHRAPQLIGQVGCARAHARHAPRGPLHGLVWHPRSVCAGCGDVCAVLLCGCTVCWLGCAYLACAVIACALRSLALRGRRACCGSPGRPAEQLRWWCDGYCSFVLVRHW